jgi:predicted nucleic acid-binding protein
VKEYVLDANALVRLYRDAPGAATVENLIRQARSGSAHLAISVINLSEAACVLARYFGSDKALRCIEAARGAIEIVEVWERQALDTAVLRLRYKLGLADSFAAELAMRTGATLVTADPDFVKLGKRLKVLALPRHSV